MTIDVFEVPESRTQNLNATDPSVDRVYRIVGTCDDTVRRGLLAAAAPQTVDVYDDGTLILPMDSAEIRSNSDGSCDCIVVYRQSYNAPVGGEATLFTGVSLSTSPGSTNVKTGIPGFTQEIYVPPGGNERLIRAQIGNNINVDANGVNGTDIQVSSFDVTIRRVLPRSLLTNEYALIVARLRDHVNDAPFFPDAGGNNFFMEGEALLTGCQFEQQGNGDWSCVFNFSGMANEENITIGNCTVPFKEGWDYLWAYYKEGKVTEPAEGELEEVTSRGSQLMSVNINRVYPRGDFSTLKLFDFTFFRPEPRLTEV